MWINSLLQGKNGHREVDVPLETCRRRPRKNSVPFTMDVRVRMRCQVVGEQRGREAERDGEPVSAGEGALRRDQQSSMCWMRG